MASSTLLLIMQRGNVFLCAENRLSGVETNMIVRIIN